MGRAKEELLRREVEKWTPIEDAQVCAKCFEDEALRAFVLSASDGIGCDYCDDSGARKRKSRNINDVIGHISECIREYYEDPAENMAYETAEGGYHGATVWQTYDLLSDLLEIENQKLFDDIERAFEMALWCKVNPYSDELRDEMFQDWDSFCEFVKYKKRFSAFEQCQSIFSSFPFDDWNMIRKIPAGSKFYRARTFFKNNPFPMEFKEITIPPKAVLIKQSNRMSPAGIPLFYCSDSIKTCIEEAKTSNVYSTSPDMIGHASFVTNRSLYVLDISDLPQVGSIFGGMSRMGREMRIFIRMFRDDIMKPVIRDGREHVDYIPSQIFTEYVRDNVTLGKHKIDGICYPSDKNKGGLNYALFLDHEEISEKQNPNGNAVIYFSDDLTTSPL